MGTKGSITLDEAIAGAAGEINIAWYSKESPIRRAWASCPSSSERWPASVVPGMYEGKPETSPIANVSHYGYITSKNRPNYTSEQQLFEVVKVTDHTTHHKRLIFVFLIGLTSIIIFT